MTTFKAVSKLALGLLCVSLLVASPAMAEFGLQRFAFSARNQDGTPDVQAGSHPYALNTTFVLNLPTGRFKSFRPQGNLKDVRLEMPPGFVGDPNATPHCPYQAFVRNNCPNETVVGLATTYLDEPGGEIYPSDNAVYNLVPPTGVAAEFAFVIPAGNDLPVFLDAGVRTGTDYGLNVTVPDISQAALVVASKVTIWGVPAAVSHNLYRGICLGQTPGVVPSSFEAPGFGLREGEDELEGPDGPYAGTGGVVVQPASRQVEESSDIGNNCAIGNAYPTFEQGRKYLAPGLFGPCGYGFPSIVGAKIGCPDTPVVGFAGDGAFGISMNEMTSIGREGWPAITMVIFRNYQWGAEKRNTTLWYADNFVGTELNPKVSYAKIAEACGFEGVTVTTPPELSAALRLACEKQMKGVTTFIEVRLNQELGEPFRRDAMKKPVVVAGVERADMQAQRTD